MSVRSDRKRNWLRDQTITGLLLTGLTIFFGLILSEIHAAVGWKFLLLSLLLILTTFFVAVWCIQRPIISSFEIALEQLNQESRQIHQSILRLLEPRSISWLLDLEQLLDYELNSDAPEIWLISSDLLEDSPDGPFEEIVRLNLARGISYVFFAPNTKEMHAKIQIISARHKNANLQIIFLPDEFFFLVPKLDVAIYNPLHIQDKPRRAYMGIPVPGEEKHYHAAVTDDFVDRLIGTLLPLYKQQLQNPAYHEDVALAKGTATDHTTSKRGKRQRRRTGN